MLWKMVWDNTGHANNIWFDWDETTDQCWYYRLTIIRTRKSAMFVTTEYSFNKAII